MLRRLMMAQASGGGGGGNNILVPPKANIVSLMHFDADYTDEVPGVTWSAETGSPGISYTNKKFGAGAFSIASRPSAIQCTTPSVGAFGSRDFTVAGWIRPTWIPKSSNNYAMFACKDYAGGSFRGWQMNLSGDSGGKLSGTVYANGTTAAWASVASLSVPPVNTWTHVAMCRRGDTLYLFMNGVLQGTATIPAGTIGNSTDSRLLYGRIDGEPNAPYSFAGQMDEFIIVDGVGMFVENFTPPAIAYSY